MCVRTTASNVGTQAMFERMKDYKSRIIEVSSHSGARPKCAKDQGKLYDLDNGSGYVEDANGKKIRYYPFSSTSYGKPDGLFGINCRHKMYPFVPKCSTQKYFPYDEEENAAEYKRVQKQRQLERNVRAAKRECMMLKDGDPEMFQKASVKLKNSTRQLKSYCDSNGLTYMNERTSVMGYGRSEAARVTAAYKRELRAEQERLNKVLDKTGESGIIDEKVNNGEITLTLNSEKQAPHMQATKAAGKSYFTIGIDELQEIVNKKHGTGLIRVTNTGQIRETITVDNDIAVNVSNDTREESPTNRFTIHYSKRRTHAVPSRKEK